MLHREKILEEVTKRMSTVTGVDFVRRNPASEPSINDLPSIVIIELDDKVEESGYRGKTPIYKRVLTIVIESFIKGSTSTKASKELFAFLEEVKKKLYGAPGSLGGLGVIFETGASRVLRPEAGSHVAGIGMSIDIRYVEDVTQIV